MSQIEAMRKRAAERNLEIKRLKAELAEVVGIAEDALAGFRCLGNNWSNRLIRYKATKEDTSCE